jgi:SOS-response transcriptional repressor LexA
MKTIGQRIRARRLALKMTQRELSSATGYSHAIVSQWENDLSKPKNTLLVARALKTSMEWLLTGEGNEDDLSVTVSTDGVINVVPADIGIRKIPIISYVQAGCWTESVECRAMDGSIETINTDLDLGSMAFALSVRGDSMAPEIQEGDVVVIDPDVDPLPGDIVAAKNGSHEATLKQFRPRGTNDQGQDYFELVPLNPVYPTMRSDHHHVTIIGVMMEHRRYRKRK